MIKYVEMSLIGIALTLTVLFVVRWHRYLRALAMPRKPWFQDPRTPHQRQLRASAIRAGLGASVILAMVSLIDILEKAGI